jgi:geranylgeranylglycerol-phosphate geranylgeranyltransferase
VTFALALVAGGEPRTALTLAVGMFGFQASIGAVNDLADADADGAVKPWKPIPAGLITRRAVALVALVGAVVGIGLSAAAGAGAVVVGLAGLGCGLAYDLGLRRIGLGWLGYSLAFPLAIAYPWMGATGGLPPGLALVVPVAVLAGPALHLANTLVDLDDDRAADQPSLARRLGRTRSVLVLAGLTGAVYLLAWATLLAPGDAPTTSIALAGVATALAAIGVVGSAARAGALRTWGWMAQASAIGLLAVAWLAGV